MPGQLEDVIRAVHGHLKAEWLEGRLAIHRDRHAAANGLTRSGIARVLEGKAIDTMTHTSGRPLVTITPELALRVSELLRESELREALRGATKVAAMMRAEIPGELGEYVFAWEEGHDDHKRWQQMLEGER